MPRSIILFTGVLLVLAACGSAASDSTSTTIEPTTAPATTTTTPPKPALPVEGAAWDLVHITHSFGLGSTAPYAALAEQALGVTVNAEEEAFGNLEAWRVLRYLKTKPRVFDLVREAEIVVIAGLPERTGNWYDTCWYHRNNADLPEKAYTEDDWQQYREEVEAVLAEVWQLRQGLPTVLLWTDGPIGIISEWRELGKEEECISGWEANSAVLRTAAEAQGATLVSLFDLFNGPDHNEDPREKGWISDDGYHPNQAGDLAIAEALAAVGFEPTTQP